jgi:mono/diheme cytochrome c family protein
MSSHSLATRLVVGLALAAGLAFGCGPAEQTSAPPAQPAAQAPAQPAAQPAAGSATAAARAEEIFSTRCFTCHGSQGAGDGPGSAALTPKPRDFRDAAWQDSVTDDHIAKIINFGGAAVGRSPAMPGNPDLIAQADVVAALVAHVRSLRAK